MKALVIVDVQGDFLPGGSLAVAGGDEIVQPIVEAAGDYDLIVTTQDWHPSNHPSFATGEPEFRDGSWPSHCVQGTPGARLDPEIEKLPAQRVYKGFLNAEAYSGFDGITDAVGGGEYLVDFLRAQGVTQVDVVGLATDYCVRATALDAQRLGFTTRVLLGGVRGVAPETTEAALAEMQNAGVTLVRPCVHCGALEQVRCCEFGADRAT